MTKSDIIVVHDDERTIAVSPEVYRLFEDHFGDAFPDASMQETIDFLDSHEDVEHAGVMWTLEDKIDDAKDYYRVIGEDDH